MNLKDLITRTIQQTGHQPFLFVGSGFSKRYMNTEKWDELLKLNQQLRLSKRNYRNAVKDLSVQGIIQTETKELAYRKLVFLEKEEIQLDDLLEHLKSFIKENTPSCLKNNSELKRLIRIYDLLRYKQ